MKKMNKKGFTLIELLAVITIMGILLLVSIPAVSRTIENTRRNTFANTAEQYISAVRNAVSADELKCNVSTATDKTVISAVPKGTYYYNIDSTSQETKDLMEQGGLSSWGNADVKGYIKIEKDTSNNKTSYKYSVLLVDKGNHGIESETYSPIKRGDVKSAVTSGKGYTDVSSKTASASIRVCELDV